MSFFEAAKDMEQAIKEIIPEEGNSCLMSSLSPTVEGKSLHLY
jgi:hypothetical protein